MLRLAARTAARRFASTRRMTVRPSRTAWLPIALRWRRKRKKAGAVSASREAMPSAPSVTWMSMFHLHFNMLANERSRREREARSFPPATVIRELRRSVMSRHWATDRVTTLAMSPRAASPTPRVFAARRAGVPVSAMTARQPFRLLTTHATATHVERRTLSSVFTTRRANVPGSVQTTHAERRALFESVRKSATSSFSERLTERRLSSHETRVFRTHSSATHRIREESARSGVQLVRPAVLVWRSAAQAQRESARETSFTNPLPAPSRPSARAAAAQEPAPDAPRRAAQRALQAGDLDPALLDRLTDDVIRRVERRVRIDRERRGL
ncbi:MAG TPA: hypothetical protein VF618_19595 [Thermoanaerobaculia bacterium]